MSQTATLLVAALVVLGAGSALVFLAYKDELYHARVATSQGARIADTIAGPIEYGEKGAGIPLLSGGGHDQGLATSAISSVMAFASSHHRVSAIGYPHPVGGIERFPSRCPYGAPQ